MALLSAILFESQDKDVIILDIPRSLEESQVAPGEAMTRRIISSIPTEEPFQLPEQKQETDVEPTSSASLAAQISDLMTGAAVEHAFEVSKESYSGLFHHPRLVGSSDQDQSSIIVTDLPTDLSGYHIPNDTQYYRGTLQAHKEAFVREAPKFDFIVLDPPWPNRSARRRVKSYVTASNLAEIRGLLSLLPMQSHLAATGLIAVWVTNKHSIHDYVTSSDGLLESWGLELVAEWTWVKITSQGDPIFDVASRWRKPWEKLLIAKRRGSSIPIGLSNKVILAVPDVHSRKPNLRGLFQEFLPPRYCGLEVFARNLTAGWWSWGDQVLQFQAKTQWTSLETSAELDT